MAEAVVERAHGVVILRRVGALNRLAAPRAVLLQPGVGGVQRMVLGELIRRLGRRIGDALD